MMDPLSRLFNQLDRGTITRRQLLQALGIAAVAAPLASAFGQGGGRAGRDGSVAPDTVSAKPPFEPTGWNTVFMDRFTLQATDYKREAAFYAMLMGWKVRSDNGSQIEMDIGDNVGSVIIRGGFVAPPAPPPPPPPAAGDSATGRGRGRGGGGGVRTQLVWDSFCWGIEPWDTNKVEAELKKRGLNPVADHSGSDFKSFHVKDPDGFNVQISNGNRRNRRQGPANGQLPAAAPFERSSFKTVWLDHISFAVTDYKESVAFYSALLGWKPTGDTGSQNECEIGDVGNIIIRRGGGGGGGRGARGDTTGAAPAAPPPRRALINHISFGVSPWDTDGVAAELTKRGLPASPDTGGKGDIHGDAAKYKSYHTRTPDGFDLQISNADKEHRTVR